MYSKGNKGENCKVREMLLFDSNIKLEFGKQVTGKEFGIFITTTSRRLFLLASDFF